jgi:prophage antirepressor-like protein
MKTSFYHYQTHSIRVATDEGDGSYWFVAGDVAAMLGYRTAEVMIRKLRNQGVAAGQVEGTNRDVTLINKRALLRTVFGSQKSVPPKMLDWFVDTLVPEVEVVHTRQARLDTAAKARPKVGQAVAPTDEIVFNDATRGRFFTAEQFAASLGIKVGRVAELENQMKVAHRALEASEGPYPPVFEYEGTAYYEIEFLRVLKAALAFSPRKLAEGHNKAINHLIRRGRLGVADAIGRSDLKVFLTGEAED